MGVHKVSSSNWAVGMTPHYPMVRACHMPKEAKTFLLTLNEVRNWKTDGVYTTL